MGLSSDDVSDEVTTTYCWMMIAIPKKLWRGFEFETDEELGKQLLRLASHVKLAKLHKHPQGPKKKAKKGYASRREVDRMSRRHWRCKENT